MDPESTIEQRFIVIFQLKGRSGTIAMIVWGRNVDEARTKFLEKMGSRWNIVEVHPFEGESGVQPDKEG